MEEHFGRIRGWVRALEGSFSLKTWGELCVCLDGIEEVVREVAIAYIVEHLGERWWKQRIPLASWRDGLDLKEKTRWGRLVGDWSRALWWNGGIWIEGGEAGDSCVSLALPEFSMRWCPPGRFWMGSPEDEAHRRRTEFLVEVFLSRGFWMGETPVTQGQYEVVTGQNPSHFQDESRLSFPQERIERRPVENVSWLDAALFCNALSRQEGLELAYEIDESIQLKGLDRMGLPCFDVTWNVGASGYRLPTEAEWEYACRAGTRTPYFTGDSMTSEEANHCGFDRSGTLPLGVQRRQPLEVGLLTPNAWGIHDIAANVSQWCWGKRIPRHQVPLAELWVDPLGGEPDTQEYFFVLRGGSWQLAMQSARSASYTISSVMSRLYSFGFRIVRSRPTTSLIPKTVRYRVYKASSQRDFPVR